MLAKLEQAINEVKKVIIGKDEIAKKVLMAILAEGHVLLEDIPGVGKTTMALAFSKALGLDFNRIQFTPDVVASDVIGFTMYDKGQEKFVFKEGVVMCNLLLADEINRTTSRTQAALLEVMEEKKVTVDGMTYDLPQPFNVIATQNPIGSYGTQMLPQSQMDRFMIKTSIGYPDFDSQVEILKDRQKEQPLDHVTAVITVDELMKMQTEVQEIHVANEMLKYITSLTEATRTNELIIQGISPRGALALSRIAKAHAYLAGRDYVIPEDVIEMFIDTGNHRIILDQKAQVSDESAESVLLGILNKVPTPDIQYNMSI
ncbi:AAA family ATPase [Pseudogracilibacillus auburnensis]|uniref:AAA family ATPase n=1 Tax=Pseudogracilibacillus auburnensis TaxID=1494959 RepID=UPI001A965964|nr:MoxR family ATPase [Pseudogracilibacillus auburnensis]MBO1005546.1 MoxR family ATPase [Pseudogracilibacillus auburnensis]